MREIYSASRAMLLGAWQDDDASAQGWAVTSLRVAVQRAALLMVASWQVVFTASALATLGAAGWPLVVLSGLLAAYSISGSRPLSPVVPQAAPIAMAALGVAGMLATNRTEQVLTLASCWQVDLATFAAGLLIRTNWILLLVPALAWTFVAVAPTSPAWPPGFAVVVAVTQTAIIVAVRSGLTLITGVARRVDRSEQEAHDAARDAAAARAVSAALAEEARTLHDTALNTLDAIASGGAAISDRGVVEKQCLRDIAVLEELRSPRDGADPGSGFMDVVALSALPVRVSGLDPAALRDVEEQLDSRTRAAATGVLREALTNAAKHSQASSIQLRAGRTEAGLRIAVVDSGVGFDPKRTRNGSGLSESIYARAAAAGIAVKVRSRPGRGTIVEMVMPLGSRWAAGDELGDRSVEPPIAQVRELLRRGSLAWAAGVTVVGFVLTLTGDHRDWRYLLPMLAVMGAAWIIAYVVPDSAPIVPVVASGLAAAAMVVFVLSAAATDFGSHHVVYWPALSATAPFVLVLSYLHDRPQWIAAISGACVLALVAIAVAAGRGSFQSAAVTATAAAVSVLFCAAWFQFQRVIEQISLAGHAAQLEVFNAQIEIAAEAATNRTHRVWLDAGLQATSELLRAIGDGELDPQNETVQRRCKTDAAFLRQILLLKPASLQLGRALVPVVESSRKRRVILQAQLGERDIADPATAAEVADIVGLVVHAQQGGEAMVVSVFPADDSIELTVVAPSINRDGPLGDRLAETGWPYEIGAGFLRATPGLPHPQREES